MGQTMDDDVAILAPAPVAEGAPTGDGVARLRTSLPSSTPTIGGSLRPDRFGVILAAITIGALSLRVGYVLAVTRHQNGKLYDSFWYYSTTIGLRSGQFFRLFGSEGGFQPGMMGQLTPR